MSSQTSQTKPEELITLNNVLKKMIDKGMFTRKTRTGESKEHAKD